MMIDRRVSLVRSCRACVKAKHRCTRQVPKCDRCSRQALLCHYDNNPSSSGVPIVEPAQPSRSCFINFQSRTSADDIAIILGARQFFQRPKFDPVLSPEAFRTGIAPDFAAQGIDLTLDYTTLSFLVHHLKSYPAAFAESHTTPFAHAQLYRDHIPKTVRDAWVLCSAYSSLDASESSLYWSIIESKISAMHESLTRASSLLLKLASCHALLLYLILILFNRDKSDRPPASSWSDKIALLRKLTAELWKTTPAIHVIIEPSAWRAWALAESVRRTILTSYLFQGVFDMLESGITRHTLFVSSLPFDSRTWLWDIDSESKWKQSTSSSMRGTGSLASFREFTDSWQKNDLPIHGTFEALLVAACKGRIAMLSRDQGLGESSRRLL